MCHRMSVCRRWGGGSILEVVVAGPRVISGRDYRRGRNIPVDGSHDVVFHLNCGLRHNKTTLTTLKAHSEAPYTSESATPCSIVSGVF